MKKVKLNKKSKSHTDKKLSEFKPGNKPYLEFDGQLLNGKVKWNIIVKEILSKGYTSQQIATTVGLRKAAITKILREQYDELFFRAGAGILTIHCKLYPDVE